MQSARTQRQGPRHKRQNKQMSSVPWHATFAQEHMEMMLVGAQIPKRMKLVIFWEQNMVNDILGSVF